VNGSDPSILEAKYRALIEQIAAITYTWSWREDRYSVEHASPQIEDILGYSPAEWAADPTAWYAWVHPDDRQLVVDENKRCELSGEPYSIEYRMLRKDGATIWVQDSWVVVGDRHDGHPVFQGLVFDITRRKLAEERTTFLAHHDPLTQLPNRGLFEELLGSAVARAKRHDLSVGVLFLDLDNFKLVNDSLGHHAGDGLLIQLAERLKACTRDEDVVARQGGDEFLLLISDLERGTDAQDEDLAARVVRTVAERVHDAMKEPFVLDGVEFMASGSLGISLFPQDALDAQTLLKNADSAMYQAKKTEPGGWVRYSTRGEDPTERLSLSTRLRRAVDMEQWILHYQPVVDLLDGSVNSLEALIRWREPNGGIVPPGEFIPLAEELGLIEAIGDWVIDEIASQQKRWADQGLDLTLSFNLSPRQLWSAHLAEKVMGKLRLAEVDAGKVVIEITESTAMADPDRTQRILTELRSWGLTLAIDDFGTGYSSLARLKHLPVDILKIDQAFIRDVHRDPGLASMVRAMIQLAQGLQMIPLAEGVESHGEYEFLRANGCLLAQGFWFARPAPACEIPELLTRVGGLIPAHEPSSEVV
jgi:diguanylate cyclase (GGDEF)-like protein/PAS domain S-box-containing protein